MTFSDLRFYQHDVQFALNLTLSYNFRFSLDFEKYLLRVAWGSNTLLTLDLTVIKLFIDKKTIEPRCQSQNSEWQKRLQN